MSDIKQLKKMTSEMEVKLSVIENDYMNKHTNLSARFDELNTGMKELTKEIQLLNREIQKKL